MSINFNKAQPLQQAFHPSTETEEEQISLPQEPTLSEPIDSFTTNMQVETEDLEEPMDDNPTSHCNPFGSLSKTFRGIYQAIAHPNRERNNQRSGVAINNTDVRQPALLSPNRLIHHTLNHSNRKALQKIQRHKVDLNSVGIGGLTPIQHAVRCENKTVTRALVKAGVDLDRFDLFGKTPLHVAASTGSEAMLSILLEADDIDINKPDSMGRTPVFMACGRNSVTFLSRLLAAGARIDGSDSFGRGPIHEAAEKRLPEHVRLLINAGADINAPDKFGHTPLDRAASFISSRTIPDRAVETITILLQHGAQPGTVNELKHFDISKVPNPRTLEGLLILLDDARQSGNQTLVNLLEQQPGLRSLAQPNGEI